MYIIVLSRAAIISKLSYYSLVEACYHYDRIIEGKGFDSILLLSQDGGKIQIFRRFAVDNRVK